MRYFVPTVVIIVLLAFACKSNVDKVEDWHKGTTDRIGATLPAPYECSRAKNAWQDMDNQRDRLLATAGPYGGSSPNVVNMWWNNWRRYVGFSELGALYCEGRYMAEDDWTWCETYAQVPAETLEANRTAMQGSMEYGMVDYCIGEGIPPFGQ